MFAASDHPVVTVDEILTFAREELQGKDDEPHAYVGVRHRHVVDLA